MIHPNSYKYLKAPTIEQIEAVVEKTGVSEAQFERVYGLYDGCICHVRIGFKPLPAKHWHLFLEPTLKPPNQMANRFTAKTTSRTPKTSRRVKSDGRVSNLI